MELKALADWKDSDERKAIVDKMKYHRDQCEIHRQLHQSYVKRLFEHDRKVRSLFSVMISNASEKGKQYHEESSIIR